MPITNRISLIVDKYVLRLWLLISFGPIQVASSESLHFKVDKDLCGKGRNEAEKKRCTIMDFTVENGIISNSFHNSVKLWDIRPMGKKQC